MYCCEFNGEYIYKNLILYLYRYNIYIDIIYDINQILINLEFYSVRYLKTYTKNIILLLRKVSTQFTLFFF